MADSSLSFKLSREVPAKAVALAPASIPVVSAPAFRYNAVEWIAHVPFFDGPDEIFPFRGFIPAGVTPYPSYLNGSGASPLRIRINLHFDYFGAETLTSVLWEIASTSGTPSVQVAPFVILDQSLRSILIEAEGLPNIWPHRLTIRARIPYGGTETITPLLTFISDAA